MAPIYIFQDIDDDPNIRGGIGSEEEYERRYGEDGAEDYRAYEYDQEYAQERNRFEDGVATLSTGSPEEVRALIDTCDTAEEVVDMLYGTKECPYYYPESYIETKGFRGSAEQFRMVMDEMRRRGKQSGDGEWGRWTLSLEEDFEGVLADYGPDTTTEKEDGKARSDDPLADQEPLWSSDNGFSGGAEPSGPIASSENGFGGPWKKALEGLGNTFGGLKHTAKSTIDDMPKTGDIDVSAYDYRRNGKTVHVKAHKRKRS